MEDSKFDSNVDWELFARAPDLSKGGGIVGGKVKERVVLLTEIVKGVSYAERKGQKNATQEAENQSERALVVGGGDEEVNGNLLEDVFDDMEEREDDEDYFPVEDSIGSEVLLADVEKGVIQGGKEQDNTTQEAPENQPDNAINEGSCDEEANENLHENELVEENYDDPNETQDDEDYFPDEDSIGSEEEATSGLSDEEYTPTPARTVKPPKRKLVAAQPLVEEELSQYEKIRAANIKEKEEFLQTLQGDWDEYKEDEGLVAGKKSAKKLKIVEREAVFTRKRASAGKSCAPLNQRAVQVLNKRGKAVRGCRSVLVNCQECGEEVRKTLLKMHIKFYHPKIQDPKPNAVTKKAGTIFASAGQDFSTWEDQGPNTMQ